MRCRPAFAHCLRLLSTVALSAVVGCGGRTLWANPDGGTNSTQDAATQRDSAVRPDAHVSPDGGGQECQEGEWWELGPTALDSVTVTSPQLSGPGMPQGVAVRLKAMVTLRGCDRLAGVTPSADWTTQQITLSAYVWHYQGLEDCPSQLSQAPEMFALSDLEQGTWTVWDAFSPDGPGALASFHMGDCVQGQDCFCDAWDGVPGTAGSQCQYDCMCQWPLTCVYEGMMDPTWGGTCQQTCSTDSDCPLPYQCVWNVLDMPEGVCDFQRATCANDEDCAEGFACLPWDENPTQRFCQPDMDPDLIYTQCEDDCDCPVGYQCLEMDDAGMRYCQIPCRGNGDCPEYLTCEDPGGWWQNNRTCGGFYD